MSLRIVFNSKTRPRGKEFVVLRELRGSATLPSRHVGSAPPREPLPRSSRVDDHAALSTEEDDRLPDSQGTGISVSTEDGVDFGMIGRGGLNEPFDPSSSSVTISLAKNFPPVTFVKARLRSWDGSNSR